MKFTEEKMEQVFTELIEQQGYQHVFVYNKHIPINRYVNPRLF